MSSFYRQQLESYLKELEVNADRVVDLAGAQNPVKGRTKTWNVQHYVIIDNGSGDIKTHQRFIERDLQETLPGNDDLGLFDVAFLLESMEYFINPFAVLKNTNDLLIPGGKLYITFPYLYPLHPPTGADMFRYTPYSARDLLLNFNFKIEKYIPRYVKNKEAWQNFIDSEGYRYDRSIERNSLYESGCIIEAVKL
jgi:SAM-dependent methyltransferase